MLAYRFIKTFDHTISVLSHSHFSSLASSTTLRACFRMEKKKKSLTIRIWKIQRARVYLSIPGSPSAILAMRLSHPLHGSLLPPGICYTCDVCGKTLSTKLTLKRHKEQQHFQPLNSAVCALCHKVFRTLNSLNNHKSIYHRRQK